VKIKFSDFKLDAVGQEIQLVGGIWAGNGQAFLCYFPEYGHEHEPIVVEMDEHDWAALIRQSDAVETEVLARAENGELIKIVARKCERNIDQSVTWTVFRRDQFTCRYCGNDTVPLTVDHIVLWEEGGPSSQENLVAACRRCNKARGRTPYTLWLQSDYYKKVSGGLGPLVRTKNFALLTTLDKIPRRIHVRSR